MVKLIKLFEIQPAYKGLVDTWDAIAGKLRENESLIESNLMKSCLEKSDIGYINISQWKTIEAFRKSVSQDIVLKYHFMGNGHPKNEISPHIYKSIITSGSFTQKGKEQLTKLFIINHKQLSLSEIKDFWLHIIDRQIKISGAFYSELFKSMHKGTKYKYLFIINSPGSKFIEGFQEMEHFVKNAVLDYSYLGVYCTIENVKK